MLSRFRQLCSRCSNRLLRWVLRISNYKWQMPNYKESQVKDQEWKAHLCSNPAYKDLCLWVVALRDKEIRRLLEGKEESREVVAKMRLLESMYNELAGALRRPEQDVD